MFWKRSSPLETVTAKALKEWNWFTSARGCASFHKAPSLPADALCCSAWFHTCKPSTWQDDSSNCCTELLRKSCYREKPFLDSRKRSYSRLQQSLHLAWSSRRPPDFPKSQDDFLHGIQCFGRSTSARNTQQAAVWRRVCCLDFVHYHKVRDKQPVESYIFFDIWDVFLFLSLYPVPSLVILAFRYKTSNPLCCNQFFSEHGQFMSSENQGTPNQESTVDSVKMETWKSWLNWRIWLMNLGQTVLAIVVILFF